MDWNYKKITLLLSGFFLTMVMSNAQNIMVQGVVLNPEHEAIELANVVAHSIQDSSVYTFAITDYQGRFNLELEKDSVYLLKIIYLGYQEQNEVLQAVADMDARVFELQPAMQTLEEVTVVYKMPVVVRGDTVSFRAESFTNGKERKLKEVFEKLPGFEVEDNGTVKVNGEKVEKITIDGKEFFTGDTKLATNNIPANVVEKINVLRNQDDIAQRRALGNEGSVAIDISLKDGQKNIVFGSAEAGGGPEDRFLGHANVFYFGKKGSINLIANANNLSEQVFTFQDMLRFNGGITGLSNKSGASTRLSSENLGLVPMKDNKAKQTNTKVGALNFTLQATNKLKFSGFAVATSLENDLLDEARRTYIGLEADANTEQLSSTIDQRSISGILKLNTKYIPGNNLHLEHNLMLQKTQLDKTELLLSNNIFEDRYFDTDDQMTRPSLVQHLNLFYTLAPKHLISLEASQQYQYQRNTFDLISKQRIYAGLIPVIDADTIQLIQTQDLQTHQFNANLTYYYLLNNTNHLGFTLGASVNDQNLMSTLLQEIPNGEVVKFDQTDLQNDVDYQYRDFYAGVYYKAKWSKLTFKPGLYAHDFYLINQQSNRKEMIRKQLVLPSVHWRYDFKKSKNLNLDYKIQTIFYDVQQYAQGSILRNYNQLFRGNPNLVNTWFHNLQLDYYSLNLYNFTTIYTMLNYQRRYNNLNNQIVYDQLDRISNPLNIQNPNDVLTLYGAIDKRWKNLKANLNISLNYGTFNNVLANSELQKSKSLTQTYTGSIETTMDNFPIIELGFRTGLNRYENEALGVQSFTNNRPFGNIEISFLKHFILLLDYEYNWYNSQSANSSSTYDILNAELFFRKGDSPFEFKLSGLNLLNTRNIRRDDFSDVLISTNTYFIQKRYFLGTLKYEF